jgi:glycosyltransferase involved in cell wall biosynthesis
MLQNKPLTRRLIPLNRRSQQIATTLRWLPQLRHRAARSSGAPPHLRFAYVELGGPTRYRVDTQIEQAVALGVQADAAELNDARRLYDLRRCDALYCHRLPLTPRVWPLLRVARARGIPIIFDTDDLVWDEREREYSFFDRRFPPPMVRDIRRTRAMMQQADALVVSTPYLATLAARAFQQPVYVNANALSQAQVAASHTAYCARRARLADDTQVVIGYFCGSPHVHDEDLASIGGALANVLARYPQVRLRLYGELTLYGQLAEARYTSQIERRAAVSWQLLPEHVAEVDIAIAPLIDNPQRRAKSAVKYLEAALVGVPVVASRLDPYADDVDQGVTGLLAATPDEWEQQLTMLVTTPALRQQLGMAARQRVLANDTSAARADGFGHILTQLLQPKR